MRTSDRLAWVVISAAALAAMLAGHACELWLENVHAFGDHQARYHHIGQGVVAELAVLLFVAALVGIIRFLTHRIRQHGAPNPDNLMPALHAIATGGFGRLSCRLIGLQISALVITELSEQRLSGYHGSLVASIAGPGHASTLAVHLLIGSILAFLVYRFARFVSARTRVLVDAVVAFTRWARVQPAGDSLIAQRVAVGSSVFTQHLSLIALGLAKRPPPLASAYFA